MLQARRVVRAWPEGGAAPALMLEYQKSHGRPTALRPVETVVLCHAKHEQPTARRWAGRGRSAQAPPSTAGFWPARVLARFVF
jgi:hypothetical protein